MRFEEDIVHGTEALPHSSREAKRPVPQAGDGTELAQIAAALWPLSAFPFRDLGTVGALVAKGLPPVAWLNACGVYAVVAPADYSFAALAPAVVLEAENVLVPWPIDRLRSVWIADARVAYIGFAGNTNPRTLRQQLKDLIHHAAGETTDRGPHRAGERLWQLAGFERFTVMAATTDGPPVPREMCDMLLERFRKRFGALPFGNRSASEFVVERLPGATIAPMPNPVPATTPITTQPTPSASPVITTIPITVTNPIIPAKEPVHMIPSEGNTSLKSAIDRALLRAHKAIVIDAVRSAPSTTTLGQMIESLKAHGLADAFLACTLAEIRSGDAGSVVAAGLAPSVAVRPQAVAAGVPMPDPVDDDEDADADMPSRISDETIIAMFRKSSRLKTEDVRRELGGSSAQVRTCMKRLAELRKVRIEGQKRATTYVWQSNV